MVQLGWIYIGISLSVFVVTFLQQYSRSSNEYFKTIIIYFDNPSTSFIMYNVVVSVGILIYKASIKVFFVESKENQTIKIADKLKNKMIDLIFFIYLTRAQLHLEMFTCIILIILIFVLHYQAIFRSEYLIHTPTLTNLQLNYRLLAFILILLYFDYQILINCMGWLSSEDGIPAMFIYYMLTISMGLIQPTVKYLFDFYQKYTFDPIPNLDQNLVLMSVIINIPRFIIQILLALWITKKFGLLYFFILSAFEFLSQLSTTIKAYRNMKKLTQTMRNLKRIDGQSIKNLHDSTCMICFLDMESAILLPCKHAFHEECIRQWIIKNSNHFCPKCKKSFNFQQNQQNAQVPQQQQQQQQQPHQHLHQHQQQQNINHQIPQQQFNQNLVRQVDYKKRTISQLVEQRQRFEEQMRSQKDSYNDADSEENSYYLMKKPIKIGSLPFSLPTEAIYDRKMIDMEKRIIFLGRNQTILKILKSSKIQQILQIPQ